VSVSRALVVGSRGDKCFGAAVLKTQTRGRIDLRGLMDDRDSVFFKAVAVGFMGRAIT